MTSRQTAWASALLALTWWAWPGAQAPGVLRVSVTLVDAAGQPAPVARHVLLVSDTPPGDEPRRLVTALDGTAEIRLRPGLYTVESDRPVAAGGRLYQWTQMVEVAAGAATTLVLTAANAEATDAPAGSDTASPESTSALALPGWHDSIVALWTPSARGSGFVVDAAAGLVLTSHRALGDATPVAVQLSPVLKVPAHVLVRDAGRDVAVLRVAPAITADLPPVPMPCAPAAAPALSEGQEIVTLGVALRGPRDLVVGTAVRRQGDLMGEFNLESGSAGGPVFTVDGRVVGLSSPVPAAADNEAPAVRIVAASSACEVLAAARGQAGEAAAPPATRLPVEPDRALSTEALERAAPPRLGSLAAYRVSSPDFDVTFITPPVAFAAGRTTDEERTGGGVSPEQAWERERLLRDFGPWFEYFRDVRPVLVVRVTPRLAEGFWTRVARGAAMTQGVALPPIKRRKPGFARMRVLCGEAEVAPIHPLVLEARASEGDAIREGLYVLPPDVLGPQCGTVSLVLHSEKAPDRGDTLAVDPKVVERVWQDFAAYRALAGP